MLLEMMIADPMYRSLQDLTVNKIINLKSHLPPDLMLLETKADPIFLHLPDPTLQMRQINLMSLHLQGPILQVIILDPMFQHLPDPTPLTKQMYHHLQDQTPLMTLKTLITTVAGQKCQHPKDQMLQTIHHPLQPVLNSQTHPPHPHSTIQTTELN